MADLHNDPYKEKREEEIDLQALFFQYIIHWPWIIASVLVCIICAWCYLHYTTPVYNISSSIVIRDDKKGGNINTLPALEDFGLNTSGQNIDNEIEILRSRTLVKNVIKELNLHITYHNREQFRKSELYQTSPIFVEIGSKEGEELHKSITLELTLNPDSSLRVKGKINDKEAHIEFKQLPASWSTDAGVLSFKRSTNPDQKTECTSITATIAPLLQVAKSYSNDLSIKPTSKTTSVTLISLKNSNKERGENFINKLVEVYNREANDDKNEITEKTAEFIGERIDIINQELGNTEEELETFKRGARMTNLSNDAQVALSESSGYEKKQVENGTQISLVTYLAEAIAKSPQEYAVLPSNVGLADLSLSALIDRYNVQVIERNRLLRNSSETNPVIVNLDSSLRSMKANILTTLASVQKGLLITQVDIERQTGKYNQRIKNTPNQERQFISISRQQEIKAGLYLMLLQKREENAIALAATTNNARIVDEALADLHPVSPKGSLVLLVAMMLGFIVPATILLIKGFLQSEIENPVDVEKLTSAPLLGTIPLADAKTTRGGAIAVYENSNTLMEETFRALRTSLQFILEKDKNVLLVTSTTSGEGKTFTATNLAISFALLSKKVVIIGLDIRKPQLNEIFSLSKKEKGITQYLANPDHDLMSLVQPSSTVANLSILPCGTIPPNPTELLARESLTQAIQILKAKFDYVIIDTAPVGLVTDTLLIGRVADASLYVCRADYTKKNDYRLLEELNTGKKLPQLCTVVNGLNIKKRKYGYYGYGKHYGYGNKYGYGQKSNIK